MTTDFLRFRSADAAVLIKGASAGVIKSKAKSRGRCGGLPREGGLPQAVDEISNNRPSRR
jgi:hypothetical protein